jgi:hypothetical protein
VPATQESTGSVNFDLLLADGRQINSASYSITGPNGFSATGAINLSASSNITTVVTGIPTETGFQISINATTTDGTAACAGSGTFDVQAGKTATVAVHLTCHEEPHFGSVLVSGTLNVCPTIDGIGASPDEVDIGSSISLSALAHDSDGGPSPLSYAWSATSGTFSDAIAPNTTFTCGEDPATVTISLTVSDGDPQPSCAATRTVEVTCSGKTPGTISDPTQGSNVASDVMAAQLPLVEIATRLKGSAGASDGLGGIRVDTGTTTVDVWWKGPLGDSQKAIAADATSRGILVNFAAAKYSHVELLAAIHTYLGRVPSVPDQLAYLAPSVDGSGIQVGVTSDFDVSQLDLGVDSFAVSSGHMENQSRFSDAPPWWGGSVVSSTGTGMLCSSGFAVNWAWSVDRNGGAGLLTANHCAPGGGVPFTTGAGTPLGTALAKPTGRSVVLDSLVIETTQNPAARIYDGGPGPGQFSKRVIGSSGTFPGMLVCHSGAFSGTVCGKGGLGLMVSIIDASAFVGFEYSDSIAIATPVTLTGCTDQNDPHCNPLPISVSQTGDSGGPVFTLAANPAQVLATGVLVGVMDCPAPPPCQDPICPVPLCQTSIAFIDLDDILIFHNISLLTTQ